MAEWYADRREAGLILAIGRAWRSRVGRTLAESSALGNGAIAQPA